MELLYHLEKAHVKHETGLRGSHRRCVRAWTATAAELQALEALHSDELLGFTRREIDTHRFLWYFCPIMKFTQ